MSSQHTPGPWRVQNWTWNLPKWTQYCILEIEGETVARTTVRRLDDCDDIKANAHLIAAAPDLLKAAKEAYRFLGAYQNVDHVRKPLRASIAKAENEGGES